MKIFLISLPDSRERRLSALRNTRICGLPFEIVDGVEAKKMRPETLVADGSQWGRELLTGEIGCYLAHLRALQRIVDYELPWAYVLEDDFCYEAHPDYGLVEIADVLPDSFDYITIFRTLGINPRYQRLYQQGPFWRVCEPEHMTTGYIIHHRFAKHVLKYHSTCKMPIDHLYSKLSQTHECYELEKPIVAIAAGLGSDIHST